MSDAVTQRPSPNVTRVGRGSGSRTSPCMSWQGVCPARTPRSRNRRVVRRAITGLVLTGRSASTCPNWTGRGRTGPGSPICAASASNMPEDWRGMRTRMRAWPRRPNCVRTSPDATGGGGWPTGRTCSCTGRSRRTCTPTVPTSARTPCDGRRSSPRPTPSSATPAHQQIHRMEIFSWDCPNTIRNSSATRWSTSTT